MRRVATSWKVIESCLWEHSHSAYLALQTGVSQRAIKQFEVALSRPLPPDFVASLLIHDGMKRSQPRWFGAQNLLSLEQIESTWEMMCALQSECDFGGNQLTRTRKLKNDLHWRTGWIPLTDFNGDKLVLDLDPGLEGKGGQVFQFFNSGSCPNRVVASSFAEYLHTIAEELSNYRFKIESGRICLKERSTLP